MQVNITQRLAQRLIHKKQNHNSRDNAKSINEELLEMVTHIRSLEDQLLAEQYRQELLLEQSQIYKSKLEKLNSRNDVQRQRITKLQEQYEVHKIKNYQLQMCQDSLRSIYSEINELTRVVQNRAEQCQMMEISTRRLQQENQMISQHVAELEEKQQHLNSTFIKFIKQFSEEEQYQSIKPAAALKEIADCLKIELSNLQNESSRTLREGSISLNIQKQAIIKLEFEYELLKQREKDDDKIQKLNEICANQSNLQTVVEEMLIKEDQLVDKLNTLQRQYSKLVKNYQTKLQRINYDHQESLIKANYFLKEQQIQKERLKMEIKQTEFKIMTKRQRYQEIFQQQEFSLKMDINLSSLKRLRQVQQRNKYLKLKINELQQTRSLLIQEKELLHSQL